MLPANVAIVYPAGRRPTNAYRFRQPQPKRLPLGIAQTYLVELTAQFYQYEEQVKTLIAQTLPALARTVATVANAQQGPAPTAALATAGIDQLVATLGQLGQHALPANAVGTLASRIAGRVAEWHQRQLQAQLIRSLGVDLRTAEPWLAERIELFVATNQTAVRTVIEGHARAVANLSYTGVRGGKAIADIEQEVDAVFVPRDRAVAIALPQVMRFHSELDTLRQRAIGVYRQRWATAQAGNSRDARRHGALRGRVYSIQKPLLFSGKPTVPGQPVGCTCQAVPVLADLLDDIEESSGGQIAYLRLASESAEAARADGAAIRLDAKKPTVALLRAKAEKAKAKCDAARAELAQAEATMRALCDGLGEVTGAPLAPVPPPPAPPPPPVDEVLPELEAVAQWPTHLSDTYEYSKWYQQKHGQALAYNDLGKALASAREVEEAGIATRAAGLATRRKKRFQYGSGEAYQRAQTKHRAEMAIEDRELAQKVKAAQAARAAADEPGDRFEPADADYLRSEFEDANASKLEELYYALSEAKEGSPAHKAAQKALDKLQADSAGKVEKLKQGLAAGNLTAAQKVTLKAARRSRLAQQASALESTADAYRLQINKSAAEQAKQTKRLRSPAHAIKISPQTQAEIDSANAWLDDNPGALVTARRNQREKSNESVGIVDAQAERVADAFMDAMYTPEESRAWELWEKAWYGNSDGPRANVYSVLSGAASDSDLATMARSIGMNSSEYGHLQSALQKQYGITQALLERTTTHDYILASRGVHSENAMGCRETGKLHAREASSWSESRKVAAGFAEVGYRSTATVVTAHVHRSRIFRSYYYNQNGGVDGEAEHIVLTDSKTFTIEERDKDFVREGDYSSINGHVGNDYEY